MPIQYVLNLSTINLLKSGIFSQLYTTHQPSIVTRILTVLTGRPGL